MKPRARTGPTFAFEEAFWRAGVRIVAGVDEAGRGPLAGPVVAAAVAFLEARAPEGLDDSKRLGARMRERLYGELTARAWVRWSVAVVGPDEIDRTDILRATHAAMRAALAGLPGVSHALVDGRAVPGLPVPHDAHVRGDALCLSIAAASVIAKVTRDRLMRQMDALYPNYGFGVHMGYATAAHRAMLERHGPCPIHRRSFAPVARAACQPP